MELTNEQLKGLPSLGQTEGIEPARKKIYIHFFLGNSNWYVAEYDPKTQTFFGLCVFGRDFKNASWGYFSLAELQSLSLHIFIKVEVDPFFIPKPAGDIEIIRHFV